MRSAITLVLLALLVTAAPQEKITLSNPVFVDTGASEFRVSSLHLNLQGSEIRALFSEVNTGTTTYKVNGKSLVCSYNGAEADALMISLNKMDLRSNSLVRRVTQKCSDDGKIGPGTITGVPQ